jgi:hypothetical protein
MPLRRHGQNRKRWRYVGLYAPELMVCAARAQIGPLGQCFWAVWDREAGRDWEHTSLRPGSNEVRMDGDLVIVEAQDLRAELRLGDSAPIEAACRSGPGWGWTRKRAGLPVVATIRSSDGERRIEGRGVDDVSAGYQQRRTSWHWSAGVGRAVDGRPVAWNLVAGINDPPSRSERAIWVEDEPWEPGPVEFDDLEGVRFAGGGRLDFDAGPERARDDDLLLFRSRYRHRFGEFRGRLDEIELAEGLGVMERHEAVW